MEGNGGVIMAGGEQRRRVRIGTRGSRLALSQAEAVARDLRRCHPNLDVELRIISTEGDRITTGPLPAWGQGVFVREIEAALLRREIDLAVHSLKDVPATLPPGVAIVAVPERADPGDVLVTADGRALNDLAAGARIGTSSLRRAALLRASRPDLDYVPVRGNVDTRWRKLLDPQGGYDGLVLAAAGLDRLRLEGVPRWPIPLTVLLPAPGQGALALEARADDHVVRALAAAVNHAPSAAAVAAERRALRDLEGGCQLPVGALATPEPGGGLRLAAAVAARDGSQVLRHEALGTTAAPEVLGAAVASALLAAGAADLLAASVPVGAGAR
jgi:hydroxymethylbilane synthase